MAAPTVGSVVLVLFPFADFSGFKKRPAVVVAQAEFGNVILCQITSKSATSKRAIKLMQDDFRSGGLQVESYARPGKLFTLDVSMIDKTVGVLDTEKTTYIKKQLQELFI